MDSSFPEVIVKLKVSFLAFPLLDRKHNSIQKTKKGYVSCGNKSYDHIYHARLLEILF